jgi:hypothetical protein
MAGMPAFARPPVPSLPRSRAAGVRGAAAWLVAVALIVQAWFAAPLAMRMEAQQRQAAWGGEAGLLLCGGGIPGGDSAIGSRQPGPDKSGGGGAAGGHDHGHCVLCQGAFAPVLFAAAQALRLPESLAAPARPASVTIHPAEGSAASYVPRAPPVSGIV